MGKYSGRLLTLSISPSGVRVCEGENKDGNPDIHKYFVVSGVSEYFSVSPSGVAEIINMAGLVSAIVSAVEEKRISTRRVAICSDCFNVDTVINIKEIISGLSFFNKDKRGKDSSKSKATPDKMVSNVRWGELTLNGSVNRVTTTSSCDKYMLQSLVQEFYSRGYEVIFVSGAQEVLFNLRQTVEASFDSQGKVIFNYDVMCGMSVFVKDIPVEISAIHMLEGKQEVLNRIHAQLKTALEHTGRNPRIYLVGSVFADLDLYDMVIADLSNSGYTVYDMFQRPEMDEETLEKIATGEIPPPFTADYGANVAMLMNPFSKSLISLTPSVGLVDVFKKNSQAIATLVLGVSALSLVGSLGLAGHRVYELYQKEQNPSRISSLQNEIANLSGRQEVLQSTIRTLTEADTTILELMKFVDTNQSDQVTIVSIDTADMLTQTTTVDGDTGVYTKSEDEEDEGDDVEEGEAGGGFSIRENIVLRGYAKTGNGAVAYYDKLFKFGLPVDPVLNGVERYKLPDGDEVYIFEIEIGGVEYDG